MRYPVTDFPIDSFPPDVTATFPHPVTGMDEYHKGNWTPHQFVTCDHCGETVWGVDGASESIVQRGLESSGWTTEYRNGSVSSDRCPDCNGHGNA